MIYFRILYFATLEKTKNYQILSLLVPPHLREDD